MTEPLSARRFSALLAGRGFVPDLVFWYDACQIPWIFGFETAPAVVIGYSVDQYMHPWHMPYSAGFDAVCVAQKDYLPLFASSPQGRSVHWLPLFCDPARAADPGQPRDIPVSFVGTLDGRVNAGRKPFLRAFRKKAPLVMASGDFAPVFARSRLVLNQSAAGEINFRVFEAMACGAALLTEAIGNGLTDLFTPGQDLLTYRRGDAAEAARLALRALADPNLADIAVAGQGKVLSRHTVQARAKTILALASRLAASGAPASRVHQLAAVRAEVRKAYAMLATDEQLPLKDADRRFFLSLSQDQPIRTI
ncbi:MAG: glycosyltransferase family protein [Solidesulfovibrio sp. DCME]|uniref:glycosyltransferase family protein n=1 Tax=Solidesulfovibrio sp. DCME TaxID=3447380 RepID=UPI003D096D9B